MSFVGYVSGALHPAWGERGNVFYVERAGHCKLPGESDPLYFVLKSRGVASYVQNVGLWILCERIGAHRSTRKGRRCILFITSNAMYPSRKEREWGAVSYLGAAGHCILRGKIRALNITWGERGAIRILRGGSWALYFMWGKRDAAPYVGKSGALYFTTREPGTVSYMERVKLFILRGKLWLRILCGKSGALYLPRNPTWKERGGASYFGKAGRCIFHWEGDALYPTWK